MSIKKINNYEILTLSSQYNKVNWKLYKDKCVLLIHDMQEYFVHPYDKNSNPYKTMLKNIIAIKEMCRYNHIPVIYSVQPPGQLEKQRGLLKDFWGQGIPKNALQENIVSELTPDKLDIILIKTRYSAFENTELNQILKRMGKNQLIITGIYAHIGCLMTATVAFMKNIKPFYICDAVADFSHEKHQFALDYVSELSGMVISTESILKDINKIF